jgi:hypothetical protein
MARTQQEKAEARKVASLKYAQKPEAKAKAAERYRRVRDNSDFKTKSRASKLMRDHGLTLVEYDKMLASQMFTCAICEKPFSAAVPRSAMSPVVDHCHSSSKIRGILHRKCNAAIGIFQDDPTLLQKSAKYLER